MTRPVATRRIDVGKPGATDGFVTDFGRAHSVWFKDPDGLEGEVLLWISKDGEVHPPGTAAVGY